MVGKSKSVYLSDDWARTDGLNFGVFMPALMDIIQNAETPLTVGVFGTWGSGKTSLLRMLEGKIREKGLVKYCPVWFTAWKYDKQDALWRAFILRVIDDLYPKEDSGERMAKDRLSEAQQEGVEYLDRLTKSVYQDVTWEGDSSWVLDWERTKLEMVKLPPWLALSLVGQREAAKDMGMAPQMDKIIEQEIETHTMQHLRSMEQFEREFEKAICKILGPDGRLIVFVDDLDRCLPEKAIEILEAIKLFLHVPQTIFVLGMDREIVRRGIESHYGTYLRDDGKERPDLPINGDSYLQKLIQLPFNLPTLNEDGRETFIGILQKQLEGDERLDGFTRKVFAVGLLPNPRQVKRALNVFNLLRNIAEEQERQGLIEKGSVSPPLLAKTVLIQSQWPELYARWRQYPTLIQRLEEEYGKEPLTEQEVITGQISPMQKRGLKAVEGETAGEERREEPKKQGGILGDYVNNRSKYALLAELLSFPLGLPADEKYKSDYRTMFIGLVPSKINVYFTLAGTAEPETAEDETLADLPTNWTEMLQSGDYAIIKDAVAQIDEQEKDKDGPVHKKIRNALVKSAQDADISPRLRASHAEAADQMGYFPEDIYDFVPVPDEKSPQIFIAKYPVTNVQYRRFVEAEDFAEQDYWVDFPEFDPESKPMQNSWGKEGFNWMQNALKNKNIGPLRWKMDLFEGSRNCFPVVEVTWFEANAYCKWLLAHWDCMEEGETIKTPAILRLPTHAEWVIAAGGEDEDRFPWGMLSDPEKEILHFANTMENGVNRTTPVWMYPQGASQPYGLMDMGGNTKEWGANFRREKSGGLFLLSCSWFDNWGNSRVSTRVNGYYPNRSSSYVGFRVCFLPSDSNV